jgi:hypothetical protein
VDARSRRVDTARVLGTVALVAGLMTALLTMMSGHDGLKPYLPAAFLILIGIGLRIEAAIVDRRP